DARHYTIPFTTPSWPMGNHEATATPCLGIHERSLPNMLVTAGRMALRALLRQRMRSALASLGIGVGIAAVMATVAIVAGGTAAIDAQRDALGADFLLIMPGSPNVGGVRG